MDVMLSSQILARFSVFHEGPRSFRTPSIRPGRWREKVPCQISSVITWPQVPRDWTRPTFPLCWDSPGRSCRSCLWL